MLRWTSVLPFCTVGAFLLLQAPIQAQTSDSHLPVSLERIRAALEEEPPILRLPRGQTKRRRSESKSGSHSGFCSLSR